MHWRKREKGAHTTTRLAGSSGRDCDDEDGADISDWQVGKETARRRIPRQRFCGKDSLNKKVRELGLIIEVTDIAASSFDLYTSLSGLVPSCEGERERGIIAARIRIFLILYRLKFQQWGRNQGREIWYTVWITNGIDEKCRWCLHSWISRDERDERY